MTETFYVLNKRYDASDPRLGRHVRHDSRSLQYQVEAEPLSTLKSVRHLRHVPTFDQGNLGSCTGNASVGCVATGLFWPTVLPFNLTLDEPYAVGVYGDATALDSFKGTYPPDDTGSDGLSVAKVLQKRGLISGYQHATSLEAVLTALSKSPVIVGTEWHGDMFNPVDGRLKITGEVQGGHEYVLDELDVENKLIWMQNSWSDSWGRRGRAYFSWDDFGTLLDADGDCTVFTPLTQPAPTPAPVPVADPKADFLRAAQTWNEKRRKGENRHFQHALDTFLSWYA